jgi:ribosomal protein S6--L-glutamate ligase
LTERPLRAGVVGIPGHASSEGLRDALAERGADCRLLDCERIAYDSEGAGVVCAGESLADLDLLVIKKLGRPYSPLMLDRLDLLAGLEAQGVRIYPGPDALRVLLNRASGTLRLLRAGIPMPATLLTEDPLEVVAAVERWGKVVLKPLYSTKARGMRVIKAGKRADVAIRAFKNAGNPFIYAQQMVELPGRDLGVVFIGGKYVGTYARVSAGAWNTTTRSGGHYERHEPNEAVMAVAERARKVFGLDFTAVDVAETPDGPLVFEVSAFGGFRGLREACGLDAAGMFADHLLADHGTQRG